uniref:YdbS-like PH domain-containing protein n=1 Tax=Oryza punctata TaxID=4537 RepID=A0A0E0L2G9_ORYPU
MLHELTLAAVSRAFIIRYRFTSCRVSVISRLSGADRTDFPYSSVTSVVVVPRFIGERSDIIITLKDGTKVDSGASLGSARSPITAAPWPPPRAPSLVARKMLIKSVVWQELSSHRGALQCQMANVQKRLRFQVQIFDQSTALAIFRGKAAYEATSCFSRELPGLLQHEEAVNQQRRQQAQAGNETLLI